MWTPFSLFYFSYKIFVYFKMLTAVRYRLSFVQAKRLTLFTNFLKKQCLYLLWRQQLCILAVCSDSIPSFLRCKLQWQGWPTRADQLGDALGINCDQDLLFAKLLLVNKKNHREKSKVFIRMYRLLKNLHKSLRRHLEDSLQS